MDVFGLSAAGLLLTLAFAGRKGWAVKFCCVAGSQCGAGVHFSFDLTVLKYLRHGQPALSFTNLKRRVLPSTEATCEGPMQSLSSLFVGNMLIRRRSRGAVIADVWIERWQRRAVNDIGRL